MTVDLLTEYVGVDAAEQARRCGLAMRVSATRREREDAKLKAAEIQDRSALRLLRGGGQMTLKPARFSGLSVPTRLRRWRREGEEEVVAIYGRNWLLSLALVSAALAFLFYALLPDIETDYYILGLFLVGYFAISIGFWILGRRAIIITRDALISRPVIGDLVRVPFASIIRFSVAPPSLVLFLIPYAVPMERLKLELRYGGEIYITLDVGRKDEILLGLKNNVHPGAPSQTAIPLSP